MQAAHARIALSGCLNRAISIDSTRTTCCVIPHAVVGVVRPEGRQFLNSR